jgi:hypothetical protein
MSLYMLGMTVITTWIMNVLLFEYSIHVAGRRWNTRALASDTDLCY